MNEIWYYTILPNQVTIKIKITKFDVDEGELLLYAPNFNDAIIISRDDIPFISEEQKQDPSTIVFEVSAVGYKNAYVAISIGTGY